MSGWHWFLAGWLALSGLIVFGKGCAGTVRRYTMFDAIFGLVEVAFLVWIVAVKL